MDTCPRHPDGHECAQTGPHSLHRVQVNFQWITWGEPEPVERFRPPKPKSKADRDRERKAHLVETIHQVTGTDPAALHRSDDAATSMAAAAAIAPRSGTQKHRLLVQYSTSEGGMTDEEAAEAAGLYIEARGWWQRCADLRNDGLIADTGTTRVSPTTGKDRAVCQITPAGLQALGVGSPA
jgi:hypothetical protein